jgi:hypothetical protein
VGLPHSSSGKDRLSTFRFYSTDVAVWYWNLVVVVLVLLVACCGFRRSEACGLVLVDDALAGKMSLAWYRCRSVLSSGHSRNPSRSTCTCACSLSAFSILRSEDRTGKG